MLVMQRLTGKAILTSHGAWLQTFIESSTHDYALLEGARYLYAERAEIALGAMR